MIVMDRKKLFVIYTEQMKIRKKVVGVCACVMTYYDP